MKSPGSVLQEHVFTTLFRKNVSCLVGDKRNEQAMACQQKDEHCSSVPCTLGIQVGPLKPFLHQHQTGSNKYLESNALTTILLLKTNWK
jgi:hypothetical protein